MLDLPENCIFDILIRLPVETLSSSRFVCKSWYEIISSPDFSYAHLRRSSDTTTAARGFICWDPTVENDSSSPPRKVFSVESNSILADRRHSWHINFLEIKDGKSTMKAYNATFFGYTVATCNGLVVLMDPPKTRLIILNPVTRELEDIPLGTTRLSDESYGLAFCHVSRRYKLLHLFMKPCGEKEKLGCEILDIGSETWRAADVPPIKRRFKFLEKPIFGLGALHWIQYVDDDECMVLVSMPMDDEKFKTMAIPDAAGGDCFYFKSVFAMGEFLGFSRGLERGSHDQIGVWVLRGLGGEYGWEKQFNIDIASGLGHNPTALLYFCGGEFVFKWQDGWMDAYHDHRHSRPLRKVETTDKWVSRVHYRWSCPHVNSLVSWRS